MCMLVFCFGQDLFGDGFQFFYQVYGCYCVQVVLGQVDFLLVEFLVDGVREEMVVVVLIFVEGEQCQLEVVVVVVMGFEVLLVKMMGQ